MHSIWQCRWQVRHRGKEQRNGLCEIDSVYNACVGPQCVGPRQCVPRNNTHTASSPAALQIVGAGKPQCCSSVPAGTVRTAAEAERSFMSPHCSHPVPSAQPKRSSGSQPRRGALAACRSG